MHIAGWFPKYIAVMQEMFGALQDGEIPTELSEVSLFLGTFQSCSKK